MSGKAEHGCSEVRRRLDAYVDEELSTEETSSIRTHLERCPPCQHRADFERGFTRLLRDKLGGVVAPEALGARIRSSLARETSGAPGRWTRWLGRPSLALAGYALAAVFLGLWLAAPTGLPGAGGRTGRPQAGAGASAESLEAVQVVLRGTIVCAPCEKSGSPIEEQRKCEAYGHFNGVLDDQGRLWYVLEGGAGSRVLEDGRLRGRRVAVDGEVIERLNYLLPKQVHLL